MVQIISRHGYWPAAGEPIRHGAFQHSFEAGFGTEADIHDCSGALIVSSGIDGDRDMRLPELLDLMDGLDLPLALHAESGGLAQALNIEMNRHAPLPWFTFGLPPYDMGTYLSLGLPFYTRIGGVNETVPFYDQAVGVWVDPDEQGWTEPRHLAGFLRDGKMLCVIDTDQHKGAPGRAWNLLRDSSVRDHPGLMLCTPRPAEAATYLASD